MKTLIMYVAMVQKDVLVTDKFVYEVNDNESIADSITRFEAIEGYQLLSYISNKATIISADGVNEIDIDITKFFTDKSKIATKDVIVAAVNKSIKERNTMIDEKIELVESIAGDNYEDMHKFVENATVKAMEEDLNTVEEDTKEAVSKMSKGMIAKLYKAVREQGGKDFYKTVVDSLAPLAAIDMVVFDLEEKMSDFSIKHNTKDSVKTWDKICAYAALIFTKLATVILGLGKFLIDTTVILGVMVGRVALYTGSEVVFAGRGIGKAFKKDLIDTLVNPNIVRAPGNDIDGEPSR